MAKATIIRMHTIEVCFRDVVVGQRFHANGITWTKTRVPGSWLETAQAYGCGQHQNFHPDLRVKLLVE